MFGGAAGSLKSTTLLIAAAQQIDNPKYRAIIFRRTLPEIRFLIDRTLEYYPNMGATVKDYNKAEKIWRWPSGAQIEFKYLDSDQDVFKYQGPEYQFIGFDESTHFMEAQIRYLVSSRMRESGFKESMKSQVFLATNPGNRGHVWHKKLFIGPKCTHCLKAPLPGTRRPGRLYNDARWPSDNVAIGQSTIFIPGLVTDHDVFGMGGERYTKKLKGLTRAMMKALLEGCWEAFEGQYFDCWNPDRHVITAADLRAKYKPWWTSWVGIDYGFGHAGVAYLFLKDETGHVYIAEEYVSHRVPVGEFACDLKGMWLDKYKPKAWFLSPECIDAHTGDSEFTRAELMSLASNINFDRAVNDRVSGWSHCYEQLDTFKVSISDDCPLLIDAIPSRIHDDSGQDTGRQKTKKEDVKKTPDDEDDAADAFRYGLVSFMQPGQMSAEERISRAVTSTDPTSAMLQRLIAEAKYRKQGAPINYRKGGRTR